MKLTNKELWLIKKVYRDLLEKAEDLKVINPDAVGIALKGVLAAARSLERFIIISPEDGANA